jgi:predicted  nucleic acid-binding Zn-ribbon protein
VKASPSEQLRLLDLQGVDSTLDRLEVRRKGLPEHQQIADAETTIAGLDDELVVATSTVSDINRELKKLELDVEQVRGRADKDNERLTSGMVTDSKALESLQSEIDSLARRQGVLEDEELEVMQRLEDASAVVTDLEGRKAATQADLAAAVERRDVAIKEIDTEVVLRTSERGTVQGGVGAELLGLYDKIRASTPGGVAAAALTRRQCTGCHLDLSGSDLVAAKNADEDEVLRCEECRRILVRTAESGL